MQTFLPYPDFKDSANVLDVKRLGKQRVECLQILQTLLENKTAWRNHPAVRMWRGYEQCLVSYGITICLEWLEQGYKDTCLTKIEEYQDGEIIKPPWLGNKEFHSSHRSNLLRKNYEWYSYFEWTEPIDLPYYWPV